MTKPQSANFFEWNYFTPTPTSTLSSRHYAAAMFQSRFTQDWISWCLTFLSLATVFEITATFYMLHGCMQANYLSNIEISGTNHVSILNVYTADITIEMKTNIVPASLQSCSLFSFHASSFNSMSDSITVKQVPRWTPRWLAVYEVTLLDLRGYRGKIHSISAANQI